MALGFLICIHVLKIRELLLRGGARSLQTKSSVTKLERKQVI